MSITEYSQIEFYLLWENKKPNGKGKEITNEYTYEGKFKDWSFHGEGKKTYVDGTIEEGEWYEGVLVKKNIIQEIENLFMKNIDELINNKFNSYAQIGNGSYHSKKDLPKLLKNWNQNIYETVIENNRLYKKNEK